MALVNFGVQNTPTGNTTPNHSFITRTIAAPTPVPTEPPVDASATTPQPSPTPQANAISNPTETASPTSQSSEGSKPAVETTELAAASGIPASGGAQATPQAGASQTIRSIVIPKSIRLKYDVKMDAKGIPLNANGDLLWLQDGKTYDARLEISHVFLGSRVQTSKGNITPEGLEPERFGDKVRSEVAAHFERDKGKVSFSANTPDTPLLPGTQDQLSVFIQLAAMFGNAPNSYPSGTILTFQAVGPRSVEEWVFTVGNMETLQLPGGEIKAIKLTRDATGEYAPKAEIWLAPDVAYLPVRIRLLQSNGDSVDQQWRSTQMP